MSCVSRRLEDKTVDEGQESPSKTAADTSSVSTADAEVTNTALNGAGDSSKESTHRDTDSSSKKRLPTPGRLVNRSPTRSRSKMGIEKDVPGSDVHDNASGSATTETLTKVGLKRKNDWNVNDRDEKFQKEFPVRKTSWLMDKMTFIGYALAISVLIWNKRNWIIREFYVQGEGHSVSKTLVCLLFIFMYSFMIWGFESFRAVGYMLNLMCPLKYSRAQSWIQNTRSQCSHVNFICSNLKTFGAPVLIKIGCKIWDYMWKFYVCKSFHDQSCRKSVIGRFVYTYRNDACYDGKASSAVCERFISYLPLIITTCITVLVGNVIVPVINDFLHARVSRREIEIQDNNLERVRQNRENRKNGAGKSPTGEIVSEKVVDADELTETERRKEELGRSS